MSVEDSGSAIRQACAHARRIMLDSAATELGARRQRLRSWTAMIGVPGANHTLSYWDVQGGRPFGVQLKELIPRNRSDVIACRNRVVPASTCRPR